MSSHELQVDLLASYAVPERIPEGPTLEAEIRKAFDAYLNSSNGWDGEFEPLIRDVVKAAQEFVRHEISPLVTAAVIAELSRMTR